VSLPCDTERILIRFPVFEELFRRPNGLRCDREKRVGAGQSASRIHLTKRKARLESNQTDQSMRGNEKVDDRIQRKSVCAEASARQSMASACRRRRSTLGSTGPSRISTVDTSDGRPRELVSGTIGHFELEQVLGRGGQAIVYLARETDTQRKVALKVWPMCGGHAEEALARVRREIEVLERLELPGVARILKTGVSNEAVFMAMEFVEGETLAHLASSSTSAGTDESDVIVEFDADDGVAESAGTGLDEEQQDLPDRTESLHLLELAERIATILHRIHEQGVVHRDIKPGNIIVTSTGEPVILDFGLALDLDEDTVAEASSWGVTGTPAYMSPEQLIGGHMRVDHRTDIYSLGVTLYEMLTLQRPFTARTREGLYQAILTGRPVAPRKLNPSLPTGLQSVLERAMARDRRSRYGSAAELADDLRRVIQGAPVRFRPEASWARLREILRRRAAVLMAVLCFAVGVAGGLALAAMRSGAAVQDESARPAARAGASTIPSIPGLPVEPHVTRAPGLDDDGSHATVGKTEDTQRKGPGSEVVLPAGRQLYLHAINVGDEHIALEGERVAGRQIRIHVGPRHGSQLLPGRVPGGPCLVPVTRLPLGLPVLLLQPISEEDPGHPVTEI
jgi:serine/threonine protein kinase